MVSERGMLNTKEQRRAGFVGGSRAVSGGRYRGVVEGGGNGWKVNVYVGR